MFFAIIIPDSRNTLYYNVFREYRYLCNHYQTSQHKLTYNIIGDIHRRDTWEPPRWSIRQAFRLHWGAFIQKAATRPAFT